MSRRFKVYYRRIPSFRLDKELTKDQVIKEKTHVYIKTVLADDVEQVFFDMQGENWSPNGEALPFIHEKGLHHTSMSVGDVAIDEQGDVVWQVAIAGWEEVRK